MIFFHPINVDAAASFVDDFEYTNFPSAYDVSTDIGASIEITDERSISGENSLKLLTTSQNGGGTLLIPLNIDYFPNIELILYHFFESSFPWFAISISGETTGGGIKEFYFEYGNPDQAWVDDGYFTFRGFTEAEKEHKWVMLYANITADLEIAFQHPDNPFDSFNPLTLTSLVFGLDGAPSADESRVIYIDAIQIGSNLDIIDIEVTSTDTSSDQSFRSSLLTPISTEPRPLPTLVLPVAAPFLLIFFGAASITIIISLFYLRKSRAPSIKE